MATFPFQEYEAQYRLMNEGIQWRVLRNGEPTGQESWAPDQETALRDLRQYLLALWEAFDRKEVADPAWNTVPWSVIKPG